MNHLEQRLVDFIRVYTDENSRPPTYREIMVSLGHKSPRAVGYHVDRLVASGDLIRKSGSRGLFLPKLSGPLTCIQGDANPELRIPGRPL